MESISFHADTPYKTLVLGTPYSGKTVFLSSLYKRLSIAQEEKGTNFYLHTDNGTRLLNTYYGMETEKKWPQRTSDFESYQFRLRTNIKHQDLNGDPQVEACDLLAYQFYDIPGQSITDVNTDTNWAKRVENLAKSTDNLLVLIDGQLVLKAINDESNAGLYSQLDFILPVVQRISGKPLHFLITKWDLIENYAISSSNASEQLDYIRKKLCLHSGFQSIIEQQNDLKIPTRLLPVSAVGNNFAILDKDKMRINPNAIPSPFHVELPIALVLWDGLRLAQQKVNNNFKGQETTVGSLKSFTQLLDYFGKIVDLVPVIPDLLPYKIGVSGFVKLIKSGIDKVIPLQEKRLNNLSLQEQNLLKVLSEFAELTKKLEIEFPSSKLADI